MPRRFQRAVPAVLAVLEVLAALAARLPTAVVATFAALLPACSVHAAPALDEPIKPLPDRVPVDAAKAALGAKLFVDRRFARDNSLSCASCHAFAQGGAFPAARPRGVGGKEHALNSPTVFNSAYNFRQLWSGGQDGIEGVVHQVVKSPAVFGSSWPEVLRKLQADAALAQGFRGAYRDGLTADNAAHAIAEYTRSLSTPNARFDQYLRGNAGAITTDERKGYELFKKYGCVACHQGVNVGGNMFQKFGVMGDYFAGRDVTPADLGRFNVTKREADRFVFKVPSLRNVALTAPYFHDGSAQTLEQAVHVMFAVQLGRPASQQDVELIVKFLGTLTGEQPKEPK